MTKDEVLKLALDALEKTNRFVWYGTHSEPIGQIAEQGNTAITAIKEALTQPQREWVGLTREEQYRDDRRTAKEIEYANAIEAKLKEKNYD
jgi:hypothetical protein